MMPGATLLTVMPRGPSSLARASVNTCTAPFVIAYAIPSGKAMRATPEVMLTIRPPSGISGSNCWVRKNSPLTLTSNSRSYASGVSSPMRRDMPMPALLTSTSRTSVSSFIRSASAWLPPPRSACTANALPPSFSIRPTTSSAAASSLA